MTYTTRRRLSRSWNYHSHPNTGGNNKIVTDLSITVQEGSDGAKTYNWRDLIKNHANATNPWNAQYMSIRGGGTGEAKMDYELQDGADWRATKETVHGWMGPASLSVTLPSSSAQLTNDVKAAFCAIAASKISPFSGGVFLGELTETLHMLRHPAQALFDLLRRHVKRAKKRTNRERNRKRKRKIAAELWLEAVFGWQPLISDAKSGAVALSRFINDFRPSERIAVDSESDEQVSTAVNQTAGVGNIDWFYNRTEKVKHSVRIVGAIRIDPVTGPFGSGSLDLFGLSWANFLPTVWELIPFSFVTDYFTNVGEIITASSLVQSRVVWVSQTVRDTRTFKFDNFSSNKFTQIPGRNGSESLFVGPTEINFTKYVRSRIASVVPSLQFNCPGFGEREWFNLAALGVANRS